MSPWGDIRNRQ